MNEDIAYAAGVKDGRLAALKEMSAFIREVRQLCDALLSSMNRVEVAPPVAVVVPVVKPSVTVVDPKLAKNKLRVPSAPPPVAVLTPVPNRARGRQLKARGHR